MADPDTTTFVKSLGWFIRFEPPTAQPALTPFYTDVVGLPFVRAGDAQHVDFFWAGEALIHEIIYERRGDGPEARDADPETAALLPIYRTPDLAALTARLRGAGAVVVGETQGDFGRQAFVRDPTGSLLGFRQAPEGSASRLDRLAERRRVRGEAFNPGCARLPEDIQELGWIQRRVADVDAMAAFYEGLLGLPKLSHAADRVVFDLGDGAGLELVPGGAAGPPPGNRAEVSATVILRIRDMEVFRERLRDQGVTVVHDLIRWDRGILAYIADPEGNLVGIEEKHHPSRYAPKQSPFPEDLEAQRRWIEHSLGGAE